MYKNNEGQLRKPGLGHYVEAKVADQHHNQQGAGKQRVVALVKDSRVDPRSVFFTNTHYGQAPKAANPNFAMLHPRR